MTGQTGRRHRRGILLLVVIALALLPTIAPAAISVVRAQGEDWVPAIKRVVKGTRISWRNPTNKVHDVSAYGENWSFSRVLDSGERASRVFWKVGRYKYRCRRHSAMIDGGCKGMCGVVRVRAPS